MIKWKVNNHLGINLKITHNFNILNAVWHYKAHLSIENITIFNLTFNSNLNNVDIFVDKFSV